VTARSNAWFCGRLLAGIAVSNPTGSLAVCRECCVVLSGGLCDGLIIHAEECGVSEGKLEPSTRGGLRSQRAVRSLKKKKKT